MKFIADSMLGRLARWLRLSGYDVLYANDVVDESIIERAKSEGRVLLSKDKNLCKKAENSGIDAMLIASEDILEQLRQVARERKLTIRSTPEFSRCPLCNGTVEKIEKSEVKNRVPKTVFESSGEFWECRDCKKIYWHGGHWENIREVVRRIDVGGH